MGGNKSLTNEGSTFRFDDKSPAGVMHVSLYSGDESKDVVEALDIFRGRVNPSENSTFTGQELKF